ncbi:MAG: lipase family protein [Schlesneria sp.]
MLSSRLVPSAFSFSFCLAVVIGCNSPSVNISPDKTSGASIVVSGYDPQTVRRMALASAATYLIDQPGGAKSSADYALIGIKDEISTVVSEEINAALVGATATEIIVAFRGTLPISHDFDEQLDCVFDWANDADLKLVSDESISPGRVHQGFRDAMHSLWDDVLRAVQKRRQTSKLPVIVTGHSKGGALARLAALRLQREKIEVAGVYTFGAPRTGDIDFAEDYAKRILLDIRFEYQNDIVPHIPPSKEKTAALLSQRNSDLPFIAHAEYQHVGRLQFYDWDGKFQEDSPETRAKRAEEFDKAFVELHFKRIASDHSLVNAYITSLKNLASDKSR